MTDEIAQQIVLASRPSVPVGLDRLRSGPGWIELSKADAI